MNEECKQKAETDRTRNDDGYVDEGIEKRPSKRIVLQGARKVLETDKIQREVTQLIVGEAQNDQHDQRHDM